jgi:chorismate dehydratase
MEPEIRIGAVKYLNAKPLIYDLEALAPEARLCLDLPSVLAEKLRMSQLDVALIPIIEYFRAGSYSLVPDIAIASYGPVLSVTLFSRVDWSNVRRIAMDVGSRTSAALAQIVLSCRFGVQPEVVALPTSLPAEQADADAVLLIGDRAMKACLPGFVHALDLGQEWHEWTGQPFVYAAWAVRESVDLGSVADALVEAKRRGVCRVGEIAFQEAPRLGLDAGFCRRYLSHLIRFNLGAQEVAGLRRFYHLACELNLAPRGVEIDLYRAARLAQSR